MKKTRVMAAGTFDHLHPGHIFYLQYALSKGDELFVVVARDSSVEHIKNLIPTDNESVRLKNIKNIEFVTDAFLGDEKDFFLVPEKINPDVIVLGYDQRAPEEEIKKRFSGIKIFRAPEFFSEQFKSSKYRTND